MYIYIYMDRVIAALSLSQSLSLSLSLSSLLPFFTSNAAVVLGLISADVFRHCGHLISATAVITASWNVQPWHSIEASTSLGMNEKGKCIHNARFGVIQDSLNPPSEYCWPILPMLFKHLCVPLLFPPTEVVPLCWGQALAETGQTVQDFQATLPCSCSTAATASLAQVFE